MCVIIGWILPLSLSLMKNLGRGNSALMICTYLTFQFASIKKKKKLFNLQEKIIIFDLYVMK